LGVLFFSAPLYLRTLWRYTNAVIIIIIIILLEHSIVPDGFGHSIVIPLLKNSDNINFMSNNYKVMTFSPELLGYLKWL